MNIYFHGTNKHNAEIILEKGFKKGTYFAKHLESSLIMGGKYIFWVYFKEDPTDNWQYISDKHISIKNILLLRQYSAKRIYSNDKLAEKIHHDNHIEFNGPNIKHCNFCKGKGEINNREWDKCANGKYGPFCPKCGGFGCIKKNGKKINES